MPGLNNGSAELPWWKNETLMSRVDYLARTTPEKVYAAFPRSPLTYDEGYREVTYAELANAVNAIAHLLVDQLGVGRSQETLAYIGPNDVRYTALALGAAKAGYKTLFTSPRNSVVAQESLFKATSCRNLISPVPRPPQTEAILESYDIGCIEIPDADELLDHPAQPFPYTKTFDEARSDEFLVVHTSGSTGIPKPLVYNHQFASTNIEHMALEPPPGYESQNHFMNNNRVFLTFPPFHGASIVSHLFNAIVHGTVMVAPTSGAITTGQGLVEALKQTRIDVGFLVPSIVLDLAQDPEALEFVSQRIQRILYCGGDLPHAIGERVRTKIPLYNQYGASEMGLTPQIHGNRTLAEWKYIEPHPDIGAEMRHVTDDFFEYTIVRRPEGCEQPAVFSIFPDIQEYGTRDLMRQHPSNPELWQWIARLDDVIVFLNGEKTNPITMEQYIVTRNASVERAVVAGSQRFQASLIVEPLEKKELSVAERAEFIEKIWPSIEEANRECPAHARIAKSHILITRPSKPMLLAGKGTVQRAGTVALYEEELDKLYADADSVTASGDANVLQLEEMAESNVQKLIQSILESTMEFKSIDLEANFFSQGMDSLQALLTLRKLRAGLALPALALSDLYTNPSITTLTRAVVGVAKNEHASEEKKALEKIDHMRQIFTKLSREIDEFEKNTHQRQHPDDAAVILTGSTGALGSHILHELLANPRVYRVYCFNRAEDGRALQQSRNEGRGIQMFLDDPRLKFLKVDLADTSFGLPEAEYADVVANATHIMHAAWPVDFNLNLQAFEPHLRGVVNLLRLCAASAQQTKLLFVSSISTVMSLTTPSQSVLEEPIDDWSSPSPIGYGQSKFVGERLITYAASVLDGIGVSLSFARVGQIAGAIAEESVPTAFPTPIDSKPIVTWNKAEWFPSLVISSVHLGALPDALGPAMGWIDWVPINVLSEVLTRFVLDDTDSFHPSSGFAPESAVNDDGKKARSPRVLHPQNPHPVSWSSVRAAVVSEVAASTGKTLEVIPMETWLARVRNDIELGAGESHGSGTTNGQASMSKAMKDDDLAELLRINPAVKLLEWYKSTLGAKMRGNVLDTKETCRSSATLRDLGGVQDVWVRKWVREWLAATGSARK